MATNFSFFNRVVHFHFLSQKTCTRPTKAVLSYFVALLNTKAHPVSTSPTMATNLSFSNRVVHFHFLSQKTCTANPLLGLGMIKLPTPVRVTRIVVRASYRPHEKLQPERGLIIPSSGEGVTPYDAILNLLKKYDDPLDTVARELSMILKKYGEHPELYDVCRRILKENSEHFFKMWEIAGCNHTDTATAILPRESHSSVQWRGFISKDLFSDLKPSEAHREFPLKDEFKMKIERDSVHEYRVVFLDKSWWFEHTLLEGYLYTDANAKYSHLAFKCGDRKHGDKHSSSLKDQTVLHIRIATPNVLVGQAKKTDCNADEKHETVLGEFVLVKVYNKK